MTLRERLSEAFSKAPRMYKDAGQRLALASPKTPEYERWSEETFGIVEVTPTIEHPGIPDDAPLRRFIDLPKALDLLVNRRLVLPRLAELIKCDPRECDARPDYNQASREDLERKVIELKEFAPDSEDTSSIYSFHSLGLVSGGLSVKNSFEDRVKQMSLNDLKQAAWFVEHERLKQDLVCSCWYGSAMESDAMWKLYCDRVGVAITTSVSRLKSSVKCHVPKLFSDHLRLSLAKIAYDDTTCCKDTAPWLIKRTAFRHEDEVRLYMDYPFVRFPGFELTVSPHRLIKEIIVTPYAQRWQSEVIEATIGRLLRPSERRIGPRNSMIVKQSTHRTPPIQAGPNRQIPASSRPSNN